MLGLKIKPLVAYRVTKSSSDRTIEKGDIVWMSKDCSLNSVLGQGSFSAREWSDFADFEVEKAEDYEIIKTNRSETCKRK